MKEYTIFVNGPHNYSLKPGHHTRIHNTYYTLQKTSPTEYKVTLNEETATFKVEGWKITCDIQSERCMTTQEILLRDMLVMSDIYSQDYSWLSHMTPICKEFLDSLETGEPLSMLSATTYQVL